MPTQRFPLQRLPDDLGLMVLSTMEYHEIFAFSFTSKKSLSMVTALRLPIHRVKLAFPNEIAVLFDRAYYRFYLKRHENDYEIRTLNDLPTSVDIYFGNIGRLTWSNQGKTIDEWIHHFCSISHQENRREVSINTRKARFDVQSLRNTFPSLKKVSIHCSGEELNVNGISSSETVLRAFLPDLETLLLYGLPPNRSIGSIGMTNLNVLHVYLDGSPYNLKLEDLLSLNVKSFVIMVNEFSIRDLNRFFKMWIKGSNPKLEYLEIYGHSSRFPDWNVLLKGLKAVEEEEEGGGSDEPQEEEPKEADAVEEPEDAQDDEDQEDYEEVEDEEEEESEGEFKAGEADEPQVGRVEAVEAQNEPEGAQEVRVEEAEAVAEEVPEDVQEEEVQEGYDEENEKEEDEEDIEDDNDYEDDESEYEDEEEPEEAQIVPVAQVPRVAQGAENTAVVKTYTIRNSLGVFAEIETEFNRSAYVNVGLKFTVFH
ncbi:hypothetical protein B9Z55_011173 [Caenorhabditis nigoni]|uniref:F-box domain-containing protein n=1 Tax=Caenorhabditis nigoni TaxID=1611254 RepID=A0A2G5UIY4_9PELO|nr:hypothetical protein B9Z55_011173 [Caenorhabditis nigoni]